jgi:S-adenosylhomocysteine hydrolase
MPCTRTLLSGVKFIVAGFADAGLRLTKAARFFLIEGNVKEIAKEHKLGAIQSGYQCYTVFYECC